MDKPLTYTHRRSEVRAGLHPVEPARDPDPREPVVVILSNGHRLEVPYPAADHLEAARTLIAAHVAAGGNEDNAVDEIWNELWLWAVEMEHDERVTPGAHPSQLRMYRTLAAGIRSVAGSEAGQAPQVRLRHHERSVRADGQ